MNAVLPNAAQAQTWEAQADFKEYMSAVNPTMPKIDVMAFPNTMHESGATRLIPFDLSEGLQTRYAATTPNLYSGYLRINAGEHLTTNFIAASQMYFVIDGAGHTDIAVGSIHWQGGDLFTLPALPTAHHVATQDTVLFWVNDAPLMSYLGVTPN